MFFLNWSVWLVAFFLFRCVSVNGQTNDGVEAKANDSCFIRQQNWYDLYVLCPTEVSCAVQGISYYDENSDFWPKEVYLDSRCLTKQPLPDSKFNQLNAVLRVLRLSQEPVCEFSSIETLDIAGTRLNNMGQLDGDQCDEECGPCPYRLKKLNLELSTIEILSNHSFCRFRQLEHLILDNCSLGSIEAKAFICLINLKQLSLSSNALSSLPVDLFRNNPHLKFIDLKSNRLQNNALHAFSSLSSLGRLILANNNISLTHTDRLILPQTITELNVDSNVASVLASEFIRLNNLT